MEGSAQHEGVAKHTSDFPLHEPSLAAVAWLSLMLRKGPQTRIVRGTDCSAGKQPSFPADWKTWLKFKAEISKLKGILELATEME